MLQHACHRSDLPVRRCLSGNVVQNAHVATQVVAPARNSDESTQTPAWAKQRHRTNMQTNTPGGALRDRVDPYQLPSWKKRNARSCQSVETACVMTKIYVDCEHDVYDELYLLLT